MQLAPVHTGASWNCADSDVPLSCSTRMRLLAAMDGSDGRSHDIFTLGGWDHE